MLSTHRSGLACVDECVVPAVVLTFMQFPIKDPIRDPIKDTIETSAPIGVGACGAAVTPDPSNQLRLAHEHFAQLDSLDSESDSESVSESDSESDSESVREIASGIGNGIARGIVSESAFAPASAAFEKIKTRISRIRAEGRLRISAQLAFCLP